MGSKDRVDFKMNNVIDRKKQIEKIKHFLLVDKKKFYKPAEIDDYLKEYNLNNSELFEIIDAMADDNFIFRWLEYISSKTLLFTNRKEFLVFLKKVISKINKDMALSFLIRALISFGEQDPNQGIVLYKQMIKSRDSDLMDYSSFPLGGAGKNNFELVLPYIKEDFENTDPERKKASIKAIRVAIENSQRLHNAEQIFELIEKASSENQNLEVRLQATEAFFELSHFKYDYCIKHLSEIAENGNSVIRLTLAHKFWLQDLRNKKDEIKILSACAKDEDKNVLSRVAMALSRKGSMFPELSLRIIKYWILNGKYSRVHDVDYSIKEIGKGNLRRSIAEVVTWISDKDEKKYLEFFIPIVLKELSSSDYIMLLQSIETWWEKNDRFKKIGIEIIRKVLIEIYPLDGEKIAVVNACFNVLDAIARKENLNVALLIDGEPEKLFQCMLIIDELRGVHKELDFDLIDKNLATYPVIRDFLGQKWFNPLKTKAKKHHPLLAILSSELDETKLNATLQAFKAETHDLKKYLLSLKIRQMVTPVAFLSYLNDMLKIILSKSKKLKNLKDGLRNSNMLFDTISEIEAISAFIQNYPVEIEPELEGKKLDLKISLDPDIYVEVISPDMFKPLKYLDGKAMGIRNRARGKILDELEHHFKDVDAVGETPWVIIVDLSRSEISVDFIEDALMGSEQFTLFLNKEKGEVVGQSLSRKKDSVHDINASINILSAVICYKTKLGTNGNFHREGKILTNSHAKNPLSEELKEKIRTSFLR